MEKYLKYSKDDLTINCFLTDQFLGYAATLLMFDSVEDREKLMDVLPDYFECDSDLPDAFMVNNKEFRKTTRSRSTTALSNRSPRVCAR
jgi:hypothetical protein